MPSCELEIKLDDPRRNYAPETPVRGHVRVKVDEPVRCDGLILGFKWTTSGRGAVDQRYDESICLHQGTWTEAGEFIYRFELAAPYEPCSYQGTLVNVEWSLEASADLPWAIDPRAEVDVRVKPPLPEALEIRSNSFVKGDGREVAGFSGAIAAILAMVGLTMSSETAEIGVMALLGGLIAFVSVYFVVGVVIGRSVFRKLTATVELSDADALIANIRYNCRRDIERIQTQLLVEEVVVTSAVKNGSDSRTTHSRVVCEVKGESPTPKSSAGTVSAQIPLPSLAQVGLPFSTKSNSLRWVVHLDFEFKAWPTQSETIPVRFIWD